VPRNSRPPVAIGAADSRAKCIVSALTNVRALEAYCEGQAITGDRLSELSRAIECFEIAVELDPRFAAAWAALARARASRALLDGRDRPELRLARMEARRALDTDSTLADAHLAVGQVRFALRDLTVTRGLTPSLAASIEHHLAARRQPRHEHSPFIP
jgi:hypothetical protein